MSVTEIILWAMAGGFAGWALVMAATPLIRWFFRTVFDWRV